MPPDERTSREALTTGISANNPNGKLILLAEIAPVVYKPPQLADDGNVTETSFLPQHSAVPSDQVL
jgi:hypothetical protein